MICWDSCSELRVRISNSIDFPVTIVAIQPENAGADDAVIVKMNPNFEELLDSTYFGGNVNDARRQEALIARNI